MDPTGAQGTCHDPGCGCGPTSRRDFIKVIGLAASTVAAAGQMPVMAGPFEEDNEYLQAIPRDKKLAKEWVASLTARGTKAVETDPTALGHVGMPVGGLFAGTVYLGGDGRLWLWDIFNRDQEGIQPRTVSYRGERLGPMSGANYVEPAQQTEPVRSRVRDPRWRDLAPARPHGLRPDRLRRPVPDRPRQLSGRRLSGPRRAGSVLALHPARGRRLVAAGDRDELHGHQRVERRSRRRAARLAGESRRLGQRGGGQGSATQPRSSATPD